MSDAKKDVRREVLGYVYADDTAPYPLARLLPGELEWMESVRQHILDDIARSFMLPPELLGVEPEADTPVEVRS